VTTVSDFLKQETQRVLQFDQPIDTIHNFFEPRPVRRTREEMRRELGLADELLLYHSSNLRSVKRIDLLLDAVARIQPRSGFKLLVLAGDEVASFQAEVRSRCLEQQVIIRSKVVDVEDYMQAVDLGLCTSESESFGLSILEGMYFGCPSVAMSVGGIPEVIEHDVSGLLTPFGDVAAFSRAVESLMHNPDRRAEMGLAAKHHARQRFSADMIVPQYESLYRRICRADV
jgi:L-malate glycosyltransferase